MRLPDWLREYAPEAATAAATAAVRQPDGPDGSPWELPADVETIREAAERVRSALVVGMPLPRFSTVEMLASELAGMLRVLIEDVAARCPRERQQMTAPALVEGMYWLDMSLWQGLQSAADCTCNLADVTLLLCRHHGRTLAGGA